jgi:hypothetical protein
MYTIFLLVSMLFCGAGWFVLMKGHQNEFFKWRCKAMLKEAYSTYGDCLAIIGGWVAILFLGFVAMCIWG